METAALESGQNRMGFHGVGRFLSLPVLPMKWKVVTSSYVACGETQRNWCHWVINFSGSSYSASHIFRTTNQGKSQMTVYSQISEKFVASLIVAVGPSQQMRVLQEEPDHNVSSDFINWNGKMDRGHCFLRNNGGAQGFTHRSESSVLHHCVSEARTPESHLYQQQGREWQTVEHQAFNEKTGPKKKYLKL